MVTCYNCGKQVSDETLICPECGALVRRYESRPKTNPEPEQKSNSWGWQQPRQPQQTQQGYQPNYNAPPYQPQYVQPTKNGKFRYSTGFSIWVWICIAGLAMVAACLILCGVVLTGNSEFTDLYMDIFRQQGMDLDTITGGVQLAASIMYINAAGCFVMILLDALLYFIPKRRMALVNLIGSVVLTVVLVILVGLNLVSIMILASGMVNNVLLRRQVPYMKR